MTAGSESAEIYIYIQAVIPQLVNNEVITLSAADVNSLKRSWSPRVESAEKKTKKEDLRASANPQRRGIATERRSQKIQIPPPVGFNLLNGAKGETDDPIRQIERGG